MVPAGTAIDTLVSVEGRRWAIEDSFETAKNEFGLDHHETRSWHGWHRHVSLVMLAFAMMAAIQHQANKPTPKKPFLSVGRSRRSSAQRTASCRNASIQPYHRMVTLAAGASGHSTEIAFKKKMATVMLGRSPFRRGRESLCQSSRNARVKLS